jgi:hypothetical protein
MPDLGRNPKKYDPSDHSFARNRLGKEVHIPGDRSPTVGYLITAISVITVLAVVFGMHRQGMLNWVPSLAEQAGFVVPDPVTKEEVINRCEDALRARYGRNASFAGDMWTRVDNTLDEGDRFVYRGSIGNARFVCSYSKKDRKPIVSY